jgi:hypothetical protein
MHMRMRGRIQRFGLVALMCSACTGVGSDEREPRVAKDGTQREISLDSVTTLDVDRLGMMSSSPGLLTELRDATVALVDVNEQRVVVVDTSGALRRSIGRRGQGPGEFQSVAGVFSLPGDSLMIFDRQRRIGYLYHRYTLTDVTLDFREWKFASDSKIELVGRFTDGTWVASQRAPMDYVQVGAKEVVDTVRLMAGLPGHPPRELAVAGIRRRVDVATSTLHTQVELDEIAPASGIVCENGVILSDTTGVRYLRPDGSLATQHAHSFARTPISRYSIASTIVERAIGQAAPSKELDAAREILQRWEAPVDSVMRDVHLDSKGGVWYVLPTESRPGGKGIAYARVVDGAVQSPNYRGPSALSIGRRFMATMEFDNERETLIHRMFRVPNNAATAGGQLGWCYHPFRW